MAVLFLALTPFLIPETRIPDRTKLDAVGAVAITGGSSRAAAPLAPPVGILKRPTVMWGNFAGLVVFSVETATSFMMTLHLQNVLGLSPFVTSLIFGIPGPVAVFAGPIAGRLISRSGYRTVLAAGVSLQSLAAIPLNFPSNDRWACRCWSRRCCSAASGT